MRWRREKDWLRREIEEGIDEYDEKQRIEKCGTLTSWPGSLPVSVRECSAFIRLSDGECVPLFC
ncbi:hypothetical protein KKF05_03315 [Patescibacteria group bacterium]|nr:hypothetical protein [Patescibacteria group bacterium]MBU1029492.1 hypothetical protein [Patescibacteria group bacterium]MBU1916336.1 hypothetical protein [Patescibacteria group bacterium]